MRYVSSQTDQYQVGNCSSERGDSNDSAKDNNSNKIAKGSSVCSM